MGDLDRCYDTALRILAQRANSSTELRRKLGRREFDPDDIESVIARLQREKLVEDADFAQAFARSRLRRAYGTTRIGMELQQRGIDEETRKKAVRAATVEEPELEHLRAAMRKRLDQLAGRIGFEELTGDRARARVIAYFVRRGYAVTDVIDVLDGDLRRRRV